MSDLMIDGKELAILVHLEQKVAESIVIEKSKSNGIARFFRAFMLGRKLAYIKKLKKCYIEPTPIVRYGLGCVSRLKCLTLTTK